MAQDQLVEAREEISGLDIGWRSTFSGRIQTYVQKWILKHPKASNREIFDEFLKASFWGPEDSMSHTIAGKLLASSLNFMQSLHVQREFIGGLQQALASSNRSSPESDGESSYSFADASKASAEFQKLMYEVRYEVASARTLVLQMPLIVRTEEEIVSVRILDLTSYKGGNQTIVVTPHTNPADNPRTIEWYKECYGVYQMRYDGNWGATGGGLQNPFNLQVEQIERLLKEMEGSEFQSCIKSMSFDPDIELIENKSAVTKLSIFLKQAIGGLRIPSPTLEGLLDMCQHLKIHPKLHNPIDLKILFNLAIDDVVLVGRDKMPLNADGELLTADKLYNPDRSIVDKYKGLVQSASFLPILAINKQALKAELDHTAESLMKAYSIGREMYEENLCGHSASIIATIQFLLRPNEGEEMQQFNANGKEYEGARQEDILPATNAGMDGGSREAPLGKFPPSITHSPTCEVVLHDPLTRKGEIQLLKKLILLKEAHLSKAAESTNAECYGHDVKNLVNAALLGGCILNKNGEAVVVDGACHQIPEGYKFQYAHEARVALKIIFSGIVKSSWEEPNSNDTSVLMALDIAIREFAEMAALEGTIFDFEAMARKSYFHLPEAPRATEFEALAQEMFDVPAMAELLDSKGITYKDFAVNALHLMHAASLEVYFKYHPTQQADYESIVEDIKEVEVEGLIAISSDLDESRIDLHSKLGAHDQTMGDNAAPDQFADM